MGCPPTWWVGRSESEGATHQFRGQPIKSARETTRNPARRITYLDARDRHEQGQYWKLEYELTADETWTIDMWVFQRDPGVASGAALTAALRDVLTAETRDRILAIKEEAAALRERARGYWLYQAVLDANVHSYPEFRAWLGDRNIYERTSWMSS